MFKLLFIFNLFKQNFSLAVVICLIVANFASNTFCLNIILQLLNIKIKKYKV